MGDAKGKETSKKGWIILFFALLAVLIGLIYYIWPSSEAFEPEDWEIVGTTDESVVEQESSSVYEDENEQEESIMEELEIDIQESVAIQQQVEAEYEKWLSSAMVMALSMEYPDLEIRGIYTATNTAMSDKLTSDGVYIIFNTGGSELVVHSFPLEEERTEGGTTDISSMNLGFASLDLVDSLPAGEDTMIQYSMDDLGDTISQSLLVSLYYH